MRDPKSPAERAAERIYRETECATVPAVLAAIIAEEYAPLVEALDDAAKALCRLTWSVQGKNVGIVNAALDKARTALGEGGAK